MSEIERIRDFLGVGPLKWVEYPEGLSLGEQFQLFLPETLTEDGKQLLTRFFIPKYRGEEVAGEEDEMLRDLVTVDTVMGGEFLPALVSKLRQMSKYKKRSGRILTLEQLRQVIRNMVFDYRVKLDAMDLKVLDAMSKNMLMSLSQIATKIGSNRPTVHYHKRKLEKRCRLEPFFRLNFSRMGLTNLLILVKGEARVESPYLLSRQELWGRWLHTLFSIAVPSTAVKEAKKFFENNFPNVWIWKANQFESSLSVSGYDTNQGDWNIDWDSWALYLNDVLTQGWDQVIPKKAEKDLVEPPEQDITSTDVRFIVKLLEKPDISSKELGEKLEYSDVHASRIKENIVSRGILQPGLHIDHIGLNENILFIVQSDPDKLNAFVQAVRELPKTWILWMESMDGRSYLTCWVELPPGSFAPFERAIRETLRPLAEFEILFRSKHEGSQLALLKLYDTQNKTWKWSPEMMKPGS